MKNQAERGEGFWKIGPKVPKLGFLGFLGVLGKMAKTAKNGKNGQKWGFLQFFLKNAKKSLFPRQNTSQGKKSEKISKNPKKVTVKIGRFSDFSLFFGGPKTRPKVANF